MAHKHLPSSLYFHDGCVVSRNTVLIPGGFNAFPDADATRIAMLFDDQWVRKDIRGDTLRSVTFHERDQRCYFVGRNGLIVAGGNGQQFGLGNLRGHWVEHQIGDTAKYGELFRIRSIGESIYACGQSSQIYRYWRGRWEHFDGGLLDLAAETLEDIDGSGESDIYSVGLMGTIVHYDGAAWQKLDSPTNAHLSNVRCISQDEVYICGNNGTFFRGNWRSWRDIGDPGYPYTYWGMHKFGSDIYLAHSGGIVKYDGQKLSVIDIGIDKKLTFYRLHGNDGILWSFGVDDLLTFDGSRWRTVKWIDN